jgi:ABC-type uncharacterized transport system substrate-binding protein
MTCVGGGRSLPFRSSTTPAGGRRMFGPCEMGGERVPTPSPWRRAPALGSTLLRLGVCLLALVAILGAATDTSAHPHIWIDTVVTFVFDRGKVVSLRLEWTFDEFYSDVLLDGLDTNKKGRLDEKAVKELYERDFATLKDSEYFIHLRLGGKKLPIREVSDFSATVLKGRVVFRFTVRLPSPVDPAATAIALGVYDESYFVDVAFAEEHPIRFEGSPDAACRYDVREDRNNPIYFGMVFPKHLQLDCRRR